MRKLLYIVLLWGVLLPAISPSHAGIRKTVNNIKAKMQEPFDTTRDSGYWKRALSHAKLNIYDTSVVYPKFLNFCVDVYRWGDRTFNTYDTTYVKSTGKKWKLMLKNNNSMDGYNGKLSSEKVPVGLHSKLTYTFGAQISFMAVSLGYMLNLNDLISGEKVDNKRLDFSFTCSRLSFEAYFNHNENAVNIDRLGNFKGGYFKKNKYDGVKRESYGVRGYYFFNHKRYAQAAPYCFSKLQRKSAGSWILGAYASHHDINMDFSNLNESIMDLSGLNQTNFPFHFNDYSLLIGYGYNWVLSPHWLINLTVAPGFGYRHTLAPSVDGNRDFYSMNYRGKFALVLNRNRFFYGLHVLTDGTWFMTKTHNLYSVNHDFNLMVGFRF